MHVYINFVFVYYGDTQNYENQLGIVRDTYTKIFLTKDIKPLTDCIYMCVCVCVCVAFKLFVFILYL